MHFGAPARQVDEQRGKQHLADGDDMAGQVRPRPPENEIQRDPREHRPEHGSRQDFDAQWTGVCDGGMRSVPGGHGDASQPLQAEEHGEHPVAPGRQSDALAFVKLLAALFDVGGICFHKPARVENPPCRMWSTQRKADAIPKKCGTRNAEWQRNKS